MSAFRLGEGDEIWSRDTVDGVETTRTIPSHGERGVKRTNRRSVWAGGMPKAPRADCLASSFVHGAFLSDETGGSLRMGAMSS